METESLTGHVLRIRLAGILLFGKVTAPMAEAIESDGHKKLHHLGT